MKENQRFKTNVSERYNRECIQMSYKVSWNLRKSEPRWRLRECDRGQTRVSDEEDRLRDEELPSDERMDEIRRREKRDIIGKLSRGFSPNTNCLCRPNTPSLMALLPVGLNLGVDSNWLLEISWSSPISFSPPTSVPLSAIVLGQDMRLLLYEEEYETISFLATGFRLVLGDWLWFLLRIYRL